MIIWKSLNYLTNILYMLYKIQDYLQKNKSAAFAENNLVEVEIAIKKYGNHPSINEITDKNLKTWWSYI